MLGDVEDMIPSLKEEDSRRRRESFGIRQLERFRKGKRVGGGSGGCARCRSEA